MRIAILIFLIVVFSSVLLNKRSEIQPWLLYRCTEERGCSPIMAFYSYEECSRVAKINSYCTTTIH